MGARVRGRGLGYCSYLRDPRTDLLVKCVRPWPRNACRVGSPLLLRRHFSVDTSEQPPHLEVSTPKCRRLPRAEQHPRNPECGPEKGRLCRVWLVKVMHLRKSYGRCGSRDRASAAPSSHRSPPLMFNQPSESWFVATHNAFIDSIDPKLKFISLTWRLETGPTNQTNHSECALHARRFSNRRRQGWVAHGALCRNSARVGSSIWNVAPLPKVDSTQMRPPCISTICLAMARPRPVPPLALVLELSI
jgi:hypothetical protein